MKGAYTLLIRVNQAITLQIKSLGDLLFKPGLWVYVGSAMGEGSTSLENRLSRHFRKEKTIYWHIDHLLNADSKIVEAIWAESTEHIECILAQAIDAEEDFITGPKGFGASDCTQGCNTHIYRYTAHDPLDKKIAQVFHEQGLQPHSTKTGQI